MKVFSGPKHPKSCIVDGIQFFSSCTFGKDNIEIIDESSPKVSFTLGDNHLIIELKKKISIPKDALIEEVENIAENLLKINELKLFKIKKKNNFIALY